MTDINMRPFAAADKAWLVEQHSIRYAMDEGFDATFGPLVDDILTDFLAHHDPDCEAGWVAEKQGQRLGSIFCVRLGEKTAKLRLFFLLPQARGKGLGKRLLATCMEFARSRGYKDMSLWTHESHTAACALYTSQGWACVASKPVHSFGVDLIEQSWHVDL
ncbi:MAG: GNAT family N-acetyltransferase [Paracoccaceae bacterium]